MDKRVHVFHKDINSKGNKTARLVFGLAYFKGVLQLFNHYPPPLKKKPIIL